MMMSSTDQKFMMMAGMGGMAEVEMGRLALQKSSNDGVKQYAQKMIDDHTMAGDELKQLASMKGVTLPMQADTKQMAMMAKMEKLSGMDFDKMYIKEAGVKAHQDMEKLFMKESMSGKDMDAKAWAAKTLGRPSSERTKWLRQSRKAQSEIFCLACLANNVVSDQINKQGSLLEESI